MPRPDIINQPQQPLSLQLRGTLDREELGEVKMKVVDPRHVERSQFGVEFLHLQLPQEGRQLHGPLHVEREHGGGGEDGHQRQVGAQQDRPVCRTESGELLGDLYQ